MELSPRSVANTSFRTVKKGYDPAEVRSYLESLSKSIEGLQSQATAMETRARAAVARLQEIAAQPAQPAPEPMPQLAQTAPEPVPQPVPQPAQAAQEPGPVLFAAPIDQVETISRTLILAQRTADTTVAEANAEARRITEDANEEARNLVSETQATVDRMLDEATSEARHAGEAKRIEIDGEVQSLLARREFLISDVDHLELHIVTQRDRLRDVATVLTDIAAKAPGGLGDVHRPALSAGGAHGFSSESPASWSVPDLPAVGAAPTVTSYDEVPEPVIDALEASSAMSGLDPAGHDDGEIEPLSVPEPVTLTPIVEPELDRTWSSGPDSGGWAEVTDVKDVTDVTDVTGVEVAEQAQQQPDEAITEEAPGVDQAPDEPDMSNDDHDQH